MNVTHIKAENIGSLNGIIHGFGLRGVDIREHLSYLGVLEPSLCDTNQIHGNTVHRLGRSRAGGILQGDAFITNEERVVCFVRTADCVPILIADKVHHAVAAVHAGWRGTGLNVAGAALEKMNAEFGTKPHDCVAAIGPRICGKCYEVGQEVITSIEALGIGDGWMAGERNIDLGLINLKLLKRAGVDANNISVLPHCTACDKTFASWRRDKKEKERQFSFIAYR